jgi:hypothetical protein
MHISGRSGHGVKIKSLVPIIERVEDSISNTSNGRYSQVITNYQCVKLRIGEMYQHTLARYVAL